MVASLLKPVRSSVVMEIWSVLKAALIIITEDYFRWPNAVFSSGVVVA
jgi:hypothetical protein